MSICTCYAADAGAGHQQLDHAVPGPRPQPEETPEVAFYVCAGPTDTTLQQLVVVAGGRWRIEECFQAAKSEAGLASYQVRDYTA